MTSDRPPLASGIADPLPRLAGARQAVLAGLAETPKVLPCRFRYDERGAMLFERLCTLTEHYPARTEFSLLRRHLPSIARRVGPRALVLEPECCRGSAASLLLSGLSDPVGHVPVDSSPSRLEAITTELVERRAAPKVETVACDLLDPVTLPAFARDAERRLAVLPGATFGSFDHEFAGKVLRWIGELCGVGGGILVGVDLPKNRASMEAAYDDVRGVAKALALNHLAFLNRELGADLRAGDFDYEARWSETHDRVEMALICSRSHTARIAGAEVRFHENERMLSEVAYKYDLGDFAALAERSGCRVQDVWTDPVWRYSVLHLTGI